MQATEYQCHHVTETDLVSYFLVLMGEKPMRGIMTYCTLIAATDQTECFAIILIQEGHNALLVSEERWCQCIETKGKS